MLVEELNSKWDIERRREACYKDPGLIERTLYVNRPNKSWSAFTL